MAHEQKGNQDKGEGSYSGTREYNKRTGEFVESGKVDEAARRAKPRSEEEARELEKAERAGKQRAKDEDPALHDPERVPDDPKFPKRK